MRPALSLGARDGRQHGAARPLARLGIRELNAGHVEIASRSRTVPAPTQTCMRMGRLSSPLGSSRGSDACHRALREVVPFFHFQSLQGLDQPHDKVLRKEDHQAFLREFIFDINVPSRRSTRITRYDGPDFLRNVAQGERTSAVKKAWIVLTGTWAGSAPPAPANKRPCATLAMLQATRQRLGKRKDKCRLSDVRVHDGDRVTHT
jgi:hypothetical protein